MRRGDIVRPLVRSKLLELVARRGVPNKCALDLLFQVLKHLMIHSRQQSEVVVHAEGSKNVSAVIDLDGSYSDFGTSDFGESRFLGHSNMEQVMNDICKSHILITGRSSFSHLLAMFCKSTVVVAIPFWHSYAYYRNAILAEISAEPFFMNVSGSNLSFAQYVLNPEAFSTILQSYNVM